jgi:chromatin structure-remodeling complex subunit SFH1
LIEAQIGELQNASEVNVVDREVTEEDVEFAAQEYNQETIDEIRESAYSDEMTTRQWKEADCRIILNVSRQVFA